MHDVATEAHEQLEHAEHAAHESSSFAPRVTITIAILAVLAAGAGSLETMESGAAIIAANSAVLNQDRATDSWNLYQAGSIKKYMLDIAAGAGGNDAQVYRDKAASEQQSETTAENAAKAQEAQRDEDLSASENHEHRHRGLTVGTTLIEIGIALSTVAIITRRRWPWISAIVLGGIGAMVAAAAYLP